jgi:hypothetical protein
MNFRKLFLALISSSTLLITNCGGTTNLTNPDASITISPQITSLSVNGTQTFTATVTGTSTKYVSWQIDGFSLGVTGSFSPTGTGLATGATVTYNAPATPPVYAEFTPGGVNEVPWSSQGQIGISVSVPSGTGFANASFGIPIIGPTSVGMLPATTSVQLGKLVYLYPYCVGWANNGINWLVNGVANGSIGTGTMTVSPQFAYYTAPAAMPMSSDTVTVTAVCQADPTKNASTTVTLTQ